MGRRSLVVPGLIRARAVTVGAAGERWVEDLPETVAALVGGGGEAVERGTAAFVTSATTATDGPAVVQVAVPDPEFARQVRTLVATSEATTSSMGLPPLSAAFRGMISIRCTPSGPLLIGGSPPPADRHGRHHSTLFRGWSRLQR